MKINRRNVSTIFLVLGMIFLAIGIGAHNTAFSWAAVACIMISLVTGGRWMRPRKK
jgi:membrane protein implicated in regulation of membrane protease activity